jgi:hypothetical protein
MPNLPSRPSIHQYSGGSSGEEYRDPLRPSRREATVAKEVNKKLPSDGVEGFGYINLQ